MIRYTEELARRKSLGPGWQPERLIEGLETYDLRCNAAYLDSFALDSDCILSYTPAEGSSGTGDSSSSRERQPPGFLRTLRRGLNALVVGGLVNALRDALESLGAWLYSSGKIKVPNVSFV